MIRELCTAGHHMRLLTTKLSTYNKKAYLPQKGACKFYFADLFRMWVGHPTS